MNRQFVARRLDFALSRSYTGWWLHFAFLFSCALSLFVAVHHAPWRDEVLVWLIARNLDFWGIFIEARHHGHPALWYFCVKTLQIIGLPYLSMPVLNWGFLMLSVWLICYRSGLPFLLRIGLTLSPVVMLHLSGNARNYAIAAPLVFGAAIWYRKSSHKFIIYSILLALLASTNIYATAVFVGISLQFLFEQCYSSESAKFSLRPLVTHYLSANLILLFGALIVALEMVPIRLSDDPVGKTYPLSLHFSNICNIQTLSIYAILIGFVLLVKHPGKPRIVGGVAMVLLTLVPALFYGIGTRHAFMLVLGIIYFFWIYHDQLLAGGGFSFLSLSPTAVRWVMVLTTLSTCFVIFPGGIYTTFVLNPATFDGSRAAAAIIAEGLDSSENFMLTNDPARIASLMLYFKNIDHFYAPPPYNPTPQYFTDYRRGIFYAPTSLVSVTPYILQFLKHHPEGQAFIVSSDIETDNNFSIPDPAYQAVPIYQSPDPLRVGKAGELYKIFLIKRLNIPNEPREL